MRRFLNKKQMKNQVRYIVERIIGKKKNLHANIELNNEVFGRHICYMCGNPETLSYTCCQSSGLIYQTCMTKALIRVSYTLQFICVWSVYNNDLG